MVLRPCRPPHARNQRLRIGQEPALRRKAPGALGRAVARGAFGGESEVSATFVFAGVELESAGIFGSTRRGATRNASAAQTAERLRRFPMRRIELSTADGLKLWQNLLAAIEADLRLCHHARLADPEMGEYLHARTGGSIGALIELIRMGCGRVMRAERAVDHKQPRLTIELLDEVRLSHGTEEHAKRGPAPATKTAARARRQRKAA